jgi:hypothetical protein
MVAVAGFLRAIVECPREHWHPALVVIDEAHLFAPFGGQGIETTATRRAVTAAVVRQAVHAIITQEQSQTENPELPLVRRATTTRRAPS